MIIYTAQQGTPEWHAALQAAFAFDTPQEAHAAYLAAKRDMHAGCTL